MTAGDESHGIEGGHPQVLRLSVSAIKGEKKENVRSVTVTEDGIAGDAHTGTARAISLLPYESFSSLTHPELTINPGDFGENITTFGVDFNKLRIGTRLALGSAVVIEVVQVGKDCHNGCVIKQTVGDCIMPREGLFAKVIAGGKLSEGDPIRIIE